MSHFPYETAVKEKIVCNLCGKNDYKILSEKGTDHLAIRSVICKNCALIYINPRMTKEWYGKYYEAEYRDKTINGENGNNFSCEQLFESTINHGKKLGELIQPYIPNTGDILEVGSGVGAVLTGMKSVLNRNIVGIEPSGQEAAYAVSRGVETHHSLIEDYADRSKKYAVIVTTQALNHFLDPKYFFTFAYNQLQDDGIIVVEVMNFRQQLKNAGKYENAVKIDHVYMFTPEVLNEFIQSAGFDIIYQDSDETTVHERIPGVPRIHIRIIGKKTNRKPFESLIISPSIYSRVSLSINKYKIYISYLIKQKLLRKNV